MPPILGPYTRGNLQAAFRRGYYIDELAAAFARGIVRESERHALPAGAVWDALDLLLDQNGKAYKRGGSVFAGPLPPEEDGIVLLVTVAAPEYSTGSRLIEIGTTGSARTLYDVTDDSTLATGIDVNGAQPTENPPLYNDLMILCDGIGDGMGTFYPPQKVYVDTSTVAVADLGAAPPNARYSCVHLSYLVLANSVEHPNRLWFSPVPLLEPDTYTITDVEAAVRGSFTISGDHTAEFLSAELTEGTPTTFHVQDSTGSDGYYSVASANYASGPDATTIVVNETVPDATVDGTLGVSWDVLEGYIDTAGPITGLASVAGVLLVFHRGNYQRILGNVPPGLPGENMEDQPASAPGCVDARSIVHLGGYVYFADETGVYRTNGVAPVSLTTPAAALGIGPLWTAAMDNFAPALGAVVSAGTWLEKWLLVTVRHPDGEAPGDGNRYQFLYYAPSGAWARLADGVTADMYATRLAPHREIYAACGDLNDPARPLRLTPIFTPTGDNMYDANGDPVIPLLELAFGDAGQLKAFQFGSLTHLLEAAA